MRRAWTTGEVRLLREWTAAGQTTADIAARLGRTIKAVSEARTAHGVRINSRWLTRDPAALERVRRLSAAGRYDREIAVALGCSRTAAGRLRRLIGLEGHPFDARYRRRRAEICRRICRANGVAHLAGLRELARRVRAAGAT